MPSLDAARPHFRGRQGPLQKRWAAHTKSSGGSAFGLQRTPDRCLFRVRSNKNNLVKTVHSIFFSRTNSSRASPSYRAPWVPSLRFLASGGVKRQRLKCLLDAAWRSGSGHDGPHDKCRSEKAPHRFQELKMALQKKAFWEHPKSAG